MSVLEGKGCLLTGATGGIGRELAMRLAAAGVRVFLTARSGAALAALAEEAARAGRVAGWFAADLAAAHGAEELASAVRQAFGTVDMLVHSAGVFPVRAVGEIGREEMDGCLNVNLSSFVWLCRELAPDMAGRGWGRIVAIGSSSAYAGFARTSVYCAAKHGLLGFARALDAELREHGVRVAVVSPGSVKTPMGRLVEGQDYATFMEPAEVARAVVQVMEMNGAAVINELRLNRMVMR